MTRSPVDVLIVIVNYRSADLALDCLASLEPEVAAHPGTRVEVVENQSGADQWERLDGEIRRRGWTSWVDLTMADRNGGFAAGNNVAIRRAMGDPEPPRVFWLLNPDTVIRPGALAALLEPLESNPKVGIIGSALEYRDGSFQYSAYRFPSILGELVDGLRFGPVTKILRSWCLLIPELTEPSEVDWVSGASFVVRHAVLQQVGLLDEGFFMYYEEVDLCRRAALAGWACWHAPASRVIHLVGQSTGGTSRKRLPRYWFASRNRYFLKHHGRLRAGFTNLLHWSALATYRLRRRVQGKPDNDPPGMLWDFLRYSVLTVKQ